MHYTPELLAGLYRSMLRMRLAEESFVEPIIDGTIRCPVHLYSGQEAVAAGIGACLESRDYVFGNHRSHGHYLAKGGSLDAMVAEVYCRKTGCARGRGGSMHLVDRQQGVMGIAPIVAGTISLALGAALASAARKDKRVSVTFFGDGATGEGVLYESMNFASLKKLPLIFVCENNLYSTHLSIREIRVKNEIADVAEPFGVRTFRVDGNDVLDVYEAAKDAVHHARSGAGPVFMEFFTYRMRGHVGPDDNVQGVHTDIRPAEEVEVWAKNDPILKFEDYLRNHYPSVDDNLNVIRNEVSAEVKAAVEKAVNSEFPDAKEVEEYVFRKKN